MRFGECATFGVFLAASLLATAPCIAEEPDVSVAIVSDEPDETTLPSAPQPRTVRLPRVEEAAPSGARPATATTAESNTSQAEIVQAVHNQPVRRKSSTAKSQSNRRRVGRRVASQTRKRGPRSQRNTRPSAVSRQSEPAGYSTAAILIRAHQLAQTANREEEYTRIVNDCEQALARAPNEEISRYARSLASWALNRRGQLRTGRGEPETALHDFMQAVRYDPTRWRAIHNRGVSQAQVGHFAAAFDDFTETIRLKPDFAKAYSNRGTLYLEAGEGERARGDFSQAIRLDGDLVNARFGHGRACALLGENGEAIASFDAALDLDENNVESYCGRGDVYADVGEYESALSDYARAIELDPEFVDAYRQGAWLLATCPDDGIRDAENAVLGAQKALELNGRVDHQLLDTLAAALACAGEFESAVSTLQEAIDVAPEDAQQEYRGRLQLYERGIPYRTMPPVHQAVFVEQP